MAHALLLYNVHVTTSNIKPNLGLPSGIRVIFSATRYHLSAPLICLPAVGEGRYLVRRSGYPRLPAGWWSLVRKN